MRRLLVSALALALVFGVLAARSNGRKPPPHVLGETLARSRPNPLGLKGGLNQIPDRPELGSFVRHSAGGATFYEFVWCDIESTKGRRDWSATDDIVASTRELGLKLFVKIRTGSCWATGRPAGRGVSSQKTASRMPSDLSTYGAFVRALVTRYAAKGVHAYAIENETNAENFWTGSPEEYERLARVGAQAVRETDPAARVLDSGVSSPAYGYAITADHLAKGKTAAAIAFYGAYFARRTAESPSRYPRATTAEGLRSAIGSAHAKRAIAFAGSAARLARAQVIDAWQLHYYDPWAQLPDVIRFIRSNGRPIEAWEIGVYWPGSSYDAVQHADETAKLFSILLGAGVRRVIYLPLTFDPSSSRDELWRGLYAANGGERAAGRVYERFLEWTVAPGASWQSAPAGALRGIAFQSSDGCALVLWADRAFAVTGSAPPGVRVEMASGASFAWGDRGFTIGPRPIVLRSSGKASALFTLIEQRRDRDA